MPEPAVIDGARPLGQPSPEQVFVYTLYRATPRVFVAYLMMAACIGIFVLMVLRGVSVFRPTTAQLLAWGASWPPVTGNGQWWRLLTSLFLHVGIIHLAVNMYALYNLGPVIERIFGNVGFLLLYVLSGICGSLASYLFSGGATTAGASGAIFGLFGAMLAFTVGQQGAIPARILATIRNNAISVGLINIGIAYVIPNIDHAAHLGGLAGGLVCGLILRQRFSPDIARGRWVRNLLCATLVPAALVLGFAVLSTNDASRAQAVNRTRLAVLRAFEELTAAGDPKEVEVRFEREVLIPWRSAREQLNSMTRWPIKGEPDLSKWKNYFRRNEGAFELYLEGLRKGDRKVRHNARQRLNLSEIELQLF